MLDERSLRDEPRLLAGSADAASDAPAPCSPAFGCAHASLVNSSFDRDIEGWRVEPNVAAAWLGSDARDDPSSGSLSVENFSRGDLPGVSLAGVAQCLAVNELTSHVLSASVYVVDASGVGGLDASFYTAADCSAGELAGPRSSNLSSAHAVWETVQASIAVPASARSLLVRLVAVKPFSAAPVTARFDDVSLE